MPNLGIQKNQRAIYQPLNPAFTGSKQPMEARAKREASLDAGKRKLEEFRRKKVERQKLAKAATVTIEDPPLGEDTNGGAPRAAVPHASLAVLPSHGPEGKPPREHAQEVQHAQAGSLAA